MLVSPENKIVLVKRLKSLGWRTAIMVGMIGVSFALDNLKLLNIPAGVQVFAGLVLGEVSKYLNTKKTNLE